MSDSAPNDDPRMVVPTWTGAQRLIASLRTAGSTWWSVFARPIFDLDAFALVPAIELEPQTEPIVDSAALRRALAGPLLEARVRWLAGPPDRGASVTDRASPLEHGFGGPDHMGLLYAWGRFCERREADFRTTDDRAALLRTWRTTVPWALLVPDVQDALRGDVVDDGRSDVAVALDALRGLRSTRGRPRKTPSLDALGVGVYRAIRRHRAGLPGTFDEQLDRALPVRGGTPSIDTRSRRFDAQSKDLGIEPLAVPFPDRAWPLPLAALAALIGTPVDELRGDRLRNLLLAPWYAQIPDAIALPDGSSLPIARPEGFRLPPQGVIDLVRAFTAAAITDWLADAEMADRLLLIAGDDPGRLGDLALVREFPALAALGRT